MSTAAKIAEFIDYITPGQLFTTKDCLSFGTRGAVDHVLYVMVKTNVIVRAADGLFYKPGPETEGPSKLEIVTAKASVFGRKLMTRARDFAKQLGLLEEDPESYKYAINGSSSSFVLRESGQRVYLQGISERKTALAASRAGTAILALWHMGEVALSKQTLTKATSGFDRSDQYEFHNSIQKMPAWLGNFVYRSAKSMPKHPTGSITAV